MALSSDSWGSSDGRAAAAGQAAAIVQRGVLRAEEKYLVRPDSTLGTWFARVQETISVAARVALQWLDESRAISEERVANHLLGVYADICAEAIRATAQVWGGGPSPHAKAEILDLLSGRVRTSPRLSWQALLQSLALCSAALEPLANGLREADLPMGEPTDCEVIAACFLGVADHAFDAVLVLC